MTVHMAFVVDRTLPLGYVSYQADEKMLVDKVCAVEKSSDQSQTKRMGAKPALSPAGGTVVLSC
jgi:hypothetical protein